MVRQKIMRISPVNRHSGPTAEAHRGELRKELDIHDIASLTRCAVRMGLVSSGN
jgi:hypothetical protein